MLLDLYDDTQKRGLSCSQKFTNSIDQLKANFRWGGGTICLLQDSAEILESRNLFCEYFCNWQSCPSKGWLCRESSETVLKKVEIGKNLRKHFLENISYRLFRTFSLILLALIAAMENKEPLNKKSRIGDVFRPIYFYWLFPNMGRLDPLPPALFWIC